MLTNSIDLSVLPSRCLEDIFFSPNGVEIVRKLTGATLLDAFIAFHTEQIHYFKDKNFPHVCIESSLFLHFLDKYSHEFKAFNFENEEQIIEKLNLYIVDEVLIQSNSVMLVCNITGALPKDASIFVHIRLNYSSRFSDIIPEEKLASARLHHFHQLYGFTDAYEKLMRS